MRVSILAALVLCLGTPGPSPGGWGAGCAPAVAGPRFFAPAMPQFAPVPIQGHGLPMFVAGPGGVCSARCVCGCNEGKPCECNGPAPAPEPLVGNRSAPPVDPPTGVDAGKLAKEPRYTVGGKSVTREEALRLVGQLADDSHKERLTVVGPDSERRALRAALEGDASLRGRVLAQDYEPGNWAVKGHRCDGLTVYLQRPDGTTLLREDKLTPASATAGLLDRIKRALGLSPPLPPGPAPPAPVGPDGKPIAPDGYSGLALGGTGLLGTLVGLGLWWLRQRMQQPQPASPAPVAVPPVQPAAPSPSGPMLPPAPAPAPTAPPPAVPAPDLASMLELAAWQLWTKRMAGTPLGQRIEQALAVLRQASLPLPVAPPQEQPRP